MGENKLSPAHTNTLLAHSSVSRIIVNMSSRRILSQTALVAGVLLFSAGLQTFAAFTEPVTSTSDAGAFAPITTVSAGQAKEGGLVLNTGGAANGLIVQDGNVGIGTAVPGSALSVNGGISAGKYHDKAAPDNGMIISGNVGIGTAVPGSALSVNGGISVGKYSDTAAPSKGVRENVLHEDGMIISGNVGIGTKSPTATLSVAGGVQIGDDTSACTAAKFGTLRFHNDSLQFCQNAATTTVVTTNVKVSSACDTGCPKGGTRLYCLPCHGCSPYVKMDLMCRYTETISVGHDYRWSDIKIGPY